MKKTIGSTRTFWIAGFFIGIVLAFGISVQPILGISIKNRPIYDLIFAFCCFGSAYLGSRIKKKNLGDIKSNNSLVWLGIAETGFAILFWTAQPDSRFFVEIDAMFNLCMVFLVYSKIFTLVFPEGNKEIIKSPPNPIVEYSTDTQKVITKGKEIFYGTVGITILIFFIGGGIVVSILMGNYEVSDIVSVSIIMGFITSFVLGIIASYKWQKWALKSGVPTKELEEAAKKAGLWWPKIKDDHN